MPAHQLPKFIDTARHDLKRTGLTDDTKVMKQVAQIDEVMAMLVYGQLTSTYMDAAKHVPDAPSVMTFGDPLNELDRFEGKPPITEGIAALVLHKGLHIGTGARVPFSAKNPTIIAKVTALSGEIMEMFTPDYQRFEPDYQFTPNRERIVRYVTEIKTPFSMSETLEQALTRTVGHAPYCFRDSPMVKEDLDLPIKQYAAGLLREAVTGMNEVLTDFGFQMMKAMPPEEKEAAAELLRLREIAKEQDPTSKLYFSDRTAALLAKALAESGPQKPGATPATPGAPTL